MVRVCPFVHLFSREPAQQQPKGLDPFRCPQNKSDSPFALQLAPILLTSFEQSQNKKKRNPFEVRL